MKFCENFQVSRISADKRFHIMYFYIPLRFTPDRGSCNAVCIGKGSKKVYMRVRE